MKMNNQIKLLVLLSHELTKAQIEEIKAKGVGEIIMLPLELKEIWGNIDAKGDLDISYLKPIIQWVEEETKQEDLVIIQGEFGATYYMVNYCFEKGLCPIYSSSERVVEEIIEGEKVITKRLFQHVNFREYKQYK